MTDAVGGGRRVVVFRVGDQHFAMDVQHVERVVRFVEPRRVPHGAPGIDGVSEVDGRLVPVVDLRQRLGGAEAGVRTNTRVLLAALEGEVIGFVVDQVLDVRPCEETELAPPPPSMVRGTARPIYTATLRRGDALVLLVDPSALADAARGAAGIPA